MAVSGWKPSPGANWHLPAVSPQGIRHKGSLWSLLYKGTNPIHDLMTSHRSLGHEWPSYSHCLWELGFSLRILGAQTFRPQWYAWKKIQKHIQQMLTMLISVEWFWIILFYSFVSSVFSNLCIINTHYVHHSNSFLPFKHHRYMAQGLGRGFPLNMGTRFP